MTPPPLCSAAYGSGGLMYCPETVSFVDKGIINKLFLYFFVSSLLQAKYSKKNYCNKRYLYLHIP